MTSHGPLSEQSSNAGGGVHSRPLLIIPLRQGVEAWGASSDASSEGGGSFHSACSGPLSERVPSLSGRSVHGARVSPHGRVSPDSRGSPRASGSPLARGSPHRGASPRGVVSPCVAVSPSSGAVVSPSSNGGSPRSAGSAARRTRELEIGAEDDQNEPQLGTRRRYASVTGPTSGAGQLEPKALNPGASPSAEVSGQLSALVRGATGGEAPGAPGAHEAGAGGAAISSGVTRTSADGQDVASRSTSIWGPWSDAQNPIDQLAAAEGPGGPGFVTDRTLSRAIAIATLAAVVIVATAFGMGGPGFAEVRTRVTFLVSTAALLVVPLVVFPAAHFFGAWHIGNPRTIFMGRFWHAPCTGAIEALANENVFYSAVTAAAGLPFSASMDTQARMALWPSLAQSPVAMIVVAEMALAPELVLYLRAQAAGLVYRPWRPFIVSRKALSSEDYDAANAAGWTLTATRTGSGESTAQTLDAYSGGFIAGDDGALTGVSRRIFGAHGLGPYPSKDTAQYPLSATAAASAAAGSASICAVHVPYLLYGVGAWLLGLTDLAKVLFDKAFPEGIVGTVQASLFVSGHSWFSLFRVANQLCLVLVLVAVLSHKIVASHTGRKAAIKVGVGTSWQVVSFDSEDNEWEASAASGGSDNASEVKMGVVNWGETGARMAAEAARRILSEALGGGQSLDLGGGRGTALSSFVLASAGGAQGTAAIVSMSNDVNERGEMLAERFLEFQAHSGTLGGTLTAIRSRMISGGTAAVYSNGEFELIGWVDKRGIKVMAHDVFEDVVDDIVRPSSGIYSFAINPTTMAVTSSGVSIGRYHFVRQFVVEPNPDVASTLTGETAIAKLNTWRSSFDPERQRPPAVETRP